ncbi:hypothetical protein RKE30_14570 [Streptomyces sp. Li-HN-5-11]|uniref:hypothetical protein n=1 Tax=Streptomyces sp. Li-HN-5-11 TaxID=3075432 RepID=UPI0028AC9A96|nr:hypothetical protein [Streptomyces sp. Li-HN-5-11]WNM31545.1 hypothetical protein RKE30_14570 [Streptomyces sp. Li-HN-5-11]
MPGDYDALLEVLDFAKDDGGAPRWWWRLTTGRGETSRQTKAAVDLTGAGGEYYRFLTDPHGFMWHKRFDETGRANLLRRLGRWLRESVLTQEIWGVLPMDRPSTVLIQLDVDKAEREMLAYPLVLAADEGGSLADRRLTFVHDVGHSRGADQDTRASADAPLHVVGVFNRSKSGEPLDLHAEQCQVFDKVRRIAADGRGLDITRRTLSYHVTHGQLNELASDAKRSMYRRDVGPWQLILHLADRGDPGSWSVAADDPDPQTPSSGKSPMSVQDLWAMLQTGGHHQRLRLVVITTRPASSPSLADQLQLFGIPSHVEPEPGTGTEAEAGAKPDSGTLAVELARQQGCAVLAFRHRIADQAAVAFLVKLYEYLLARTLALPQAVAAALADCRPAMDTLDAAAPVLYGAEACGLIVNPPLLPKTDEPLEKDSAASLIGHHDPMWTASEIIARIREANGVVLHGMAGVGKTTCATELISQYAGTYREVVRYPRKGTRMAADPSEALKGFVEVLLQQEMLQQAMLRRARAAGEDGLPAPESLLADELTFDRFCKDVEENLTEMGTGYVLVFLSDIDHLITRRPRDMHPSPGEFPPGEGTWLNERWNRLIKAMTEPKSGGFRLLITSPVPLRLDQERMPDVPVPLLAPAEAFLYARSLPRLGRLISDAARDVSGESGRRLVRKVLSRAEGHPGLLRYADDLAGQPGGEDRLRSLAAATVGELGQGAPEELPEAWRKIEEWADNAMEEVPPGDPRHLLLLVLSRLRPAHRVLYLGDGQAPGLLAEVWAGLRSRRRELSPHGTEVERPEGEARQGNGEVEELSELLDSLSRSCLIDCLHLPGGEQTTIRLQPAVDFAVRRWHDRIPGDVMALLAEVDRIAIQHTAGRVKEALRHRTHGRTADVQRLIPEALPYLERVGDWDAWLLLVAVLMARSRRGPGLKAMVRKLKEVADTMEPRSSARFEMAQRLSQVFKALDEGDRPGLSKLLGEGPGEPVVDNSPLAMAMGSGILSGLRDTGRLEVAREVGDDYLRHVRPATRVGLVPSAVEVELLRVMVDQGEVSQALERIPSAFESLADVRFRDAVHADWADGEILRKKLFTIRRDGHALLAEAASADEAARARHLDQARADHERLAQYFVPEGRNSVEEHLHLVEGCLLGLDPGLDGDRETLRRYDGELVKRLRAVERSGDVAILAMTDSARARIQRAMARLARERCRPEAEHAAMKEARDYELKALRLFYAQGTPMDIGICHRRIADDQLVCRSPSLRRSTPVHQMFAALLGRLTRAHALGERPSDREEWRRHREEGGVLPATVQELCARVREELYGQGSCPAPGVVEPDTVLRKLVENDEELEEAFRSVTADS